MAVEDTSPESESESADGGEGEAESTDTATGVCGWAAETMDTDDKIPHEIQVEALEQAKRNVPRNDDNRGEKVLIAWFNNLGISNSLMRLDGEHTCQDCFSKGHVYVWRGWGELCGWCSYARFTNGGENPREVTDWWERPDEFYPEGCAPDQNDRR